MVIGTLFQTPAPERLEIRPDVTVEIDATGTVVAVHPAGSTSGVDAERRAGEVVRLGPDRRLLPGLVDVHVDAPQRPQLGTGLDLPLERWLFDYTFPLEAR